MSDPTLVDTSILARMRDADHPRRATCIEALRRLIATGRPCICAQVLIEFWAVATRPREVNGLGLTVDEAEKDLDDWGQSLELLPEPPDVAARWRALVRQYAVQGRQSHDTRLVAVMLATCSCVRQPSSTSKPARASAIPSFCSVTFPAGETYSLHMFQRRVSCVRVRPGFSSEGRRLGWRVCRSRLAAHAP